MSKAFSHLSFADLSAMESFTIQVLEQIKKSSNGDLIPRYGRFIVIHEKLCEEIFARIEAEENRFFAQEKVPQKKVKKPHTFAVRCKVKVTVRSHKPRRCWFESSHRHQTQTPAPHDCESGRFFCA